MKEKTNYSKLVKIFKKNGNYITREDVDKAYIPSWFLYDFAKKNNLIKISPGFYASKEYSVDEYYLLQRRYPKFIFAGMSALYLLSLTDKVVDFFDVVAPEGYNPSREKNSMLFVRRISDNSKYKLGISSVKTMFGNNVNVYDPERTICDLIKYRDNYDSETFIKAIKGYVKKYNNQIKLMNYAKTLGIEKRVFEIMEFVTNEN